MLGGGGAGAPPDSQSIFFWGGDPDLRPETAETVSVGFVARPDALPGLHLEANGFQIDYTDRVLPPRSEEHTSELQSLMRNSYPVLCSNKKRSTIVDTLTIPSNITQNICTIYRLSQ